MVSSFSPVHILGEALVDVVSDGTDQRVTPGGGPLNVAVGLARLGVQTVLATQFGTDQSGRLIASHLADAGVTVDRTDRPTSVARATVKEDGSATYDFQITWDRGSHSIPMSPPPAIAHTGSIAAFMQPGCAAATALFQDVPQSTVRSFDPNIRPPLLDRAAALQQFDALASRAHVVKLSDEDADWLYPGESPEQVIDRLLRAGAHLVAITLGAAGSIIASTPERVVIPAPSVNVADTIGAGDAYMSGLLFALLQDAAIDRLHESEMDAATLKRLGTFATVSAATTVGRPGANPPLLHELLTALPEATNIVGPGNR